MGFWYNQHIPIFDYSDFAQPLRDLVREFTDRSQFLMVTHAKTTMEAADLLYGVTMEEPGVSKRVAVRMTDYEAVAAG